MPSSDPGAARERTDLAWQRSGFSYLAIAGVVLGVAAHHDAPWLLGVSAVLVAVAAAVWRHGRTAYQRDDVRPHPRELGLLTAVPALVAVVAAVVVVVIS